MENKPNGNQEIENPQFLKGACAKCGTDLTMPTPPIILNNHVVVSSVIIPHPKGINCPKCGQYHNAMIAGHQAQMVIAPAEQPVLNEDLVIKPASVLPFRGN